ncbi:MAG: translation elongation factor Ts [Isosphaeraceae bacterium]|nr:translation elongation factor Ts [Isosphaeraceae bacterium]
MAEITAQAVNEFRKRTGLGLMECKALLQEADGDMKKAETLAKERGLKKAEGRAGRAAKAGRVEVALAPDGKAGAMVELNCETDFVARNDAFRQAAKDLAEQVLQLGDKDVTGQKAVKDPARTVRDVLLDLNARTGENVGLARAVRFEATGRVDFYVHHDAKSGALVAVDGTEDPQLVKDLALQVVAAKPLAVRREDLPADVVAEQKRIFKMQVPADKPENIREKIAEGKLNAWYGESVLLDQEFVKDPSKKVRDVVNAAGQGITVRQFARFVVGEAAETEASAAS